MDKILFFKVFCLESYKSVHKLSGPQAHDIFVRYGVFDYISKCYDVLHANGRLFIVSDINEYISCRKEELV